MSGSAFSVMDKKMALSMKTHQNKLYEQAKNKNPIKLENVFVKHYAPNHMDRVKQIWYLSPMRAAKVQASLRIRAVSPELRCSLIQAVSQEEPSDRKPDPWPL